MSVNDTRTNLNSFTSFEEMMLSEIYRNFILCNNTVLQNPYPNDGQQYCNATFDGYKCWDYTKAGATSYGQCPMFMVHQFGYQPDDDTCVIEDDAVHYLGNNHDNLDDDTCVIEDDAAHFLGNNHDNLDHVNSSGTFNPDDVNFAIDASNIFENEGALSSQPATTQTIGLPSKTCNPDGTWYTHPETNRPWTDYSPCSETDKVRRAKSVMYVYFCGYGLSVVALIIAMFIFICNRQLKCTRVTIHKHLFLSYILTAILWTIYYATSSFDASVVQNNPIWCRVLHVMAQYVTVSNYAWMFCEGFYLHTLLVLAFTNEKRLFIISCLIGWGFPIIPCVIYSILRSTGSENNNCWHDDTFLIWIFSGPIAFSLLMNLLFLFNIMRILCSKVRSIRQQTSHPLRQSLRATCILIPLLGLQHIALPFRPSASNEHGQYVYDMMSACLSSFQGFLVALLFCFLNGEVLNLLRGQLSILRRRLSRIRSTERSFIYSVVDVSGEKSCDTCVRQSSIKKISDEQISAVTTHV